MTTRRRFLTILAGVSTLPVIGIKGASAAENWRGIALGAEAQLILDHPEAPRLIAGAVDEIRRLENIFSLYQGDSQLSRLNRDGTLSAPALELVELLSKCAALNARTNGAFDPTIQPLWALYARAAATAADQTPSTDQIEATKALTGWRDIAFDPGNIAFKKPGMALTLNGIAQGYIADKVTTYFRENGVNNVLINTGEIAAMGVSPEGTPWPVTLKDSGEKVPLTNAAIATSSTHGTVFDGAGKLGHIIDPRTGYPGGNWQSLSVISASAAEADGLSTAFCLMSEDEIELTKGDAEVRIGTPV